MSVEEGLSTMDIYSCLFVYGIQMEMGEHLAKAQALFAR